MTRETEPRSNVSRIARVCADDAALTEFVGTLVALAERGLPAMFHADEHEFAHTRERVDGELRTVGHSPRYGGITLLGVRHLELAFSVQEDVDLAVADRESPRLAVVTGRSQDSV